MMMHAADLVVLMVVLGNVVVLMVAMMSAVSFKCGPWWRRSSALWRRARSPPAPG
jgi:hypothetical protein